MFIIDAHLDLSMNASEWNRDLKKNVKEVNERENEMTDKPDRGNAVVSLPELRKGGGFGKEQCPYDLEMIADLQKLSGLFIKHGYSNEDIENIMHGNWLRFLRNAWK